ELGAAVEPAYNLLVRQGRNRTVEQLFFIRAAMITGIDAIEELLHFHGAVTRAEEAALLGIRQGRPPLLFQKLMPDEQSRAEGAAAVAGGGLHPKILERPVAEQLAVRDAVQSDTASHDEIL